MADLGPFSRVLQKHAGRAKERILQNLGKADKTTDEEFDLHVKNFNKQHNSVLRLQKEFKNYHQCLKALQIARKGLMDTVSELYEPCWTGTDTFLIKSEVLNKNLDDFSEKINAQLIAPVGSYLCQFPEFTTKISKRNRKMLDYDNSRHNLENVEMMKKREDGKISKAKEHLEEARKNFELINSELNDELPALFDSRVSFFASHLQCLFIAEAHFHEKDSTVFSEISSLLESLDEEYKKNKIVTNKSMNFLVEGDKDESRLSEYHSAAEGKSFSEPESSGSPNETNLTLEMVTQHPNLDMDKLTDKESVTKEPEENGSEKHENEIFQVAKSDANDNQPDYHVLYQVRSTYKYVAEDADELSFEVGEVINVIAYDDPDDQDDGWLMGVMDGKKGLFPANFTSRI